MRLDGELWDRVWHFAGLPFTRCLVVGSIIAAAYTLVAPRLATRDARERALLAASVAMIAAVTTPLLAVGWIVFALALRGVVEAPAARPIRIALAIVLLAAFVVAPVVWIGPLGDHGTHVREITAFATNMALLRFVAWAVDRFAGRIERTPASRYLLAMLFFPTFVNGPIEPARELVGDWTPPGRDERVRGAARIARGVAKLLVFALALPLGWMQGLAQAPDAAWWQLWAWAFVLYVFFYTSFSAWTDVAIGLGAFCGRTVAENFYAPWVASDPADFWRRWHVTFGRWLRDYVYIPLGGNRRHRAANVAITFLVSALWHVWGTLKILGFGYYPVHAWAPMLLWGGLHAVGVGVSRRLPPEPAGAHAVARSVATTLFAAWAWIPFFLPADVSVVDALRLLGRMVWPFVD
jgi:hypothetical protein